MHFVVGHEQHRIHGGMVLSYGWLPLLLAFVRVYCLVCVLVLSCGIMSSNSKAFEKFMTACG